MAGGHAWQGGMRGRGVCMVGGMHGRGHALWGHAWQGACMVGGMRGRYYEIRSMSGRYASYWNAFLLQHRFDLFNNIYLSLNENTIRIMANKLPDYQHYFCICQ